MQNKPKLLRGSLSHAYNSDNTPILPALDRPGRSYVVRKYSLAKEYLVKTKQSENVPRISNRTFTRIGDLFASKKSVPEDTSNMIECVEGRAYKNMTSGNNRFVSHLRGVSDSVMKSSVPPSRNCLMRIGNKENMNQESDNTQFLCCKRIERSRRSGRYSSCGHTRQEKV